jgi:hypothetical protein
MTDWRQLESFAFGDSPAPAARRRSPVRRRAMVLGGHRNHGAYRRRFSEVDAAFAYDEGEGDRSLESWRQAPEIFHPIA